MCSDGATTAASGRAARTSPCASRHSTVAPAGGRRSGAGAPSATNVGCSTSSIDCGDVHSAAGTTNVGTAPRWRRRSDTATASCAHRSATARPTALANAARRAGVQPRCAEPLSQHCSSPVATTPAAPARSRGGSWRGSAVNAVTTTEATAAPSETPVDVGVDSDASATSTSTPGNSAAAAAIVIAASSAATATAKASRTGGPAAVPPASRTLHRIVGLPMRRCPGEWTAAGVREAGALTPTQAHRRRRGRSV